jgi:hypothetical protein
MLRTFEATIDRGRIEPHEDVSIEGRVRVLVTILEDERFPGDAAILAESALSEGWTGPEADAAWAHLADLPDLDQGKRP